jgi:hypothetical protein
MKVKLLKKLRKDYKFKYKHGNWHVLQCGYIRRHYHTFESALLAVLDAKATYHNSDFDWLWERIKHKYTVKIQTRKFNKL